MKYRYKASTVFIFVLVLMILYVVTSASEGFVDAGRCGVGLPPCSGERVRCMNGYCKSDIPPAYPAVSKLPMTPPTKY
jgi:hypothetical protein